MRELPGELLHALKAAPPARVVRPGTCAIDLPITGEHVKDGPFLEVFERGKDGEFTFLEVRPCAVQHESVAPKLWAIYLLWPVPLNYDRDVTLTRIVLHMPNWQTRGVGFASQELWAKSLPVHVPARINFVLL